MTYSLVARDADTGCLGVAVQSHFFSVGSIVPWAEAGVGAIATQSFAEPSYGPLGLDLLRGGVGAPDALQRLIAADPLSATRQVGMIDAEGSTAAHTGPGCIAAAGHRIEHGVAAQANMMERDTVWHAMLSAYSETGRGFAERLLAALRAAEAEGGDIRGRQSAAMLIVGAKPSDRPWEGVMVDLRVDDHPDPLAELARLVAYHGAYQRLGQVLFQPGGIIGTYQLSEQELDRALAELTAAQETLGENPEPTFWRGVLLARAGRHTDAGIAFRAAAATNPAWIEFARRLPAAGLLDSKVSVGLA